MNRFGVAIALTAAIVVVGAIAAAVLSNGGSEQAATAPETTVATPTTADAGGVVPEPFDRDDLPADLEFVSRDWITDFSRTTIAYDELLIGIQATPIRDRIAPIDNPVFEAASSAGHVDGLEPGLSLTVNEDARFYPLSILTSHEIVNDVVGGQPVAVTFCPLCNSAIVFDRVVDGKELRFGVSGLLRNSDLVMWDNDTESLWQQLTGEGIVGASARVDLAA